MIRILIYLAALLAAPACSAQQVKDDEATFAADMAQRLSKATRREFVVVSPLTLRVKGSKPDEMSLFLDRIYQFCQHNNAEDCEVSKANFASSTAEAFTEMPPITADLLRVVVRSSEYCAQIPVSDKKGRSGPLHRPFAEGLCSVMMVDYPRSRKSVSRGDLDDLKLTPDVAWATATAQALKAAPRIGDFPSDGRPLALQGGDYVPSALLDTQAWQALAARTKGELVMAVPGDDLVVVYAGMSGEEIGRLREIARKDNESAERGISPLVYRWNGSGWSVVE